MSEHANCPRLVAHLNSLSKGSDEQKALALQLVYILDDVESIADLIDHEAPAMGHALERAGHISDCARRLKFLVSELATQKTVEEMEACRG